MILKKSLVKFISLVLFMGVLLSQFSPSDKAVDKTDDGDQVSVQASKIISPTYNFSFESLIPVLEAPVFGIYVPLKASLNVVITNFINGYFSKLFEHHIAINAP